MDLDLTYPAISDLRQAARRRLPKFAFEYLDSGTGAERGVARNRAALDAVTFLPSILKGRTEAQLTTHLLGHDYALPFGIAPIGMSGMIWPGAERLLARAAAQANIPYAISNVATKTPEDMAPHIGSIGWFQHYPVNDPAIMRDMLARAKAAGFKVLILTVDVPGESRRERQRRAMISLPPKITPWIVWQVLTHPTWALGTMREGSPRLKFVEDYAKQAGGNAFVHAGRVIRGYPDLSYVQAVRDAWDGPLVVKGILDPAPVPDLMAAGVDALWVSNHTGRQLDAAPSPVTMLPQIRAAAGDDLPLIFDSGVAGGLDICKALALGADFVFLGRAFHYAVAALGARGPAHLIHILKADMEATMSQLGTKTLGELGSRVMQDMAP